MKPTLRALMVEDNEDDAALLAREIERAGYALVSERVDTAVAMTSALERTEWDIVLSDYSMPTFGAIEALHVLKRARKDIPFLIVSGTVGEETAVSCLRAGAHDFLVKGRLARLPSAIERELRATRSRIARADEEQRNRSLELARIRAEDRLRLVIDAARNAMIIADEQGTMTLVNARAAQMFAYADHELLGKRVEMLMPERFRAGATATSFFEQAQSRLGCELFGRRKDGAEFPVEVELIPFQTGEGKFVLTSIVDVTERKKVEAALRESEQRFRQIAEGINEVFWMTDVRKQQMLYISPGYEQIWGRPCQSVYDDPGTWAAAIHPDDRARVLHAAMTKQETGEYNETYRITRPDGSLRWIRDRAFPIRDETGCVFRVTGIAEDITDYRRLEQQFRKAQKMEAIGTLAGGIAHDFNNILAAITGYAALAKTAAVDNGEVLEYVDEIHRAGMRGADLVRQILAFSRQQEHKRVPLQLRDVVLESLKLLRATIPSTVEFISSLPTSTPAVLADATQIHQIVMNLGTNAWHAMRDCVGRIEVSLSDVTVDAALVERHPGLRRGHFVRLSVTDSGQGMDEQTKQRIFEPFFTTKPIGEGTGLGLSVVHGIMESHDGGIVVQSELGVGTSFHLYFPAIEAAAAKQHAGDGSVPRGCGQHILVVDDEEPLARLGKKVLEQLGYTVEMHTSATEALAAFRADPQGFDLVLTDQTMPAMTGTELARALLDVRPSLPIVLTTGHAGGMSLEQVAAAGVRDVLVKPATPKALGETVHRLLTAPSDPPRS